VLQHQQVPTARSVSAHILLRVEKDAAFASASLDAALERTVQLSPADRRLTTELVYGVLRCERYLDRRIGAHVRRGTDKLDVEVRVHLRVAVYQLLILDRIPAFTTMSDAVDLVRDARGPHVARFANAVLRQIATEVEQHGHVPRHDAVKASLDPLLVQRVANALGSEDEANAMLCAGPFPAPLGIRVRSGQSVDTWMQVLRDACPGLRVERGKVIQQALLLAGAGRPDVLPGFDSSWCVQEEGSQVLGAALHAQPGDVVLDACAGRGNKTLLLSEQVGPSGCVDTADLHESKLRTLAARAACIGLPLHNVYAVDWTVGAGDVPDGYDRVLVDAPCSGVGTLRRRPEIGHRDLDRTVGALHNLQVEILARAALRCRSGGRVVYAVCSVLREEAESVVDAVLSRGVPVELAAFDSDHPIELLRGQTSMRLLPHRHGTDGYFVAGLRRR